jgi:hypothetical protein
MYAPGDVHVQHVVAIYRTEELYNTKARGQGQPAGMAMPTVSIVPRSRSLQHDSPIPIPRGRLTGRGLESIKNISIDFLTPYLHHGHRFLAVRPSRRLTRTCFGSRVACTMCSVQSHQRRQIGYWHCCHVRVIAGDIAVRHRDIACWQDKHPLRSSLLAQGCARCRLGVIT